MQHLPQMAGYFFFEVIPSWIRLAPFALKSNSDYELELWDTQVQNILKWGLIV